MGPVTLMSVLPAIRNSKVYPRKIPDFSDAQLEVWNYSRNAWHFPTFEASATNIGHKDYAPPPKEPSDNDFPMTMTGILSSRFLTLPANFSFFFHFPLLCQGLGGYEAFDHRWLCGHGGEPVIWGTGGGWRWQGGALCDSKVHTSLPWEFVPQQRRVVVGLGEPTWEGMDFFCCCSASRAVFIFL